MNDTIFTIGHSNHEIGAFLELLLRHGITALADVRSHPFSRRYPQFDKATLTSALTGANLRYVFLGDALGARPRDPACYTDGRADFDRIRASTAFSDGLRRVREGSREFRFCLMCAERDPAACHRALLVGQALHESHSKIAHILADGSIEAHDDLLRRIAGADTANASLFDEGDLLLLAARKQARRIAWQPEEPEEAD